MSLPRPRPGLLAVGKVELLQPRNGAAGPEPGSGPGHGDAVAAQALPLGVQRGADGGVATGAHLGFVAGQGRQQGRLGVREELPAYRGACAVRTDEQVAGGATAVVEECGDLATVLFVMGAGLTEVHHVVEAGQQQLPQGDPVDGM